MSFGGGFATVYTLQVIVILTHSTAVRSFALSAYLAWMMNHSKLNRSAGFILNWEAEPLVEQ